MIKKWVISSLLCLFFCGSYAEFRTWEDRNGNQFEAEFVREMFDKVTLKKKDGTEIRMGVDEFSDLDQKYFRVMVAPNISIEAKRFSGVREPLAYSPIEDESFITTLTKETITITKTSKRTFTSRLTLEVFMIAKELDEGYRNFVLMDYSTTSFLLNQGRDGAFVYKTKTIETEQYNQRSTTQKRGESYAGYIIVVRDAQGNQVGFDTTVTEKWVDDPAVIQNLRDLWARGSASKYSRHFDKTGKKIAVPRVKHFRNN